MSQSLVKAVFATVLFFVWTTTFPQSWNWANRAGNNGPEFLSSISTDKLNNCYAGMSSWGSSGGQVTFNSNTFTLNGTTDFFIVKYSSTGEELWVKQFGGPFFPQMQSEQYDAISMLSYDPVSNCLIAYGSFVGTCDFGSISISSSDYDDQDIFIAKFDLEGNCIWAKRAGSGGMDRPNSMSVDSQGNAYVCAMFPYGGNFGAIQVQNGGHLAKYDPEGNVLWVKKIFSNPGPGISFPLVFLYSKIVNQSLYLTGYNTASVFTVDTITMAIPGYSGQLIAKFDLSGSIQWMNCAGGPQGNGSITQLGADVQNNFYFSGYFTGEFATFGTDTIHSFGTKEMYVVKYNPMGEVIWIRQSNASQSALGTSAYIGNDGFLYVTGGFNGAMNFGSFALNSISTNDLYILKMDQEGNFIGGDNTNGGTGYYIQQDLNGFLNIYGSLMYTANFGNITLTEQGQGGWGDMFVAQHTPITVGVTELKSNHSNDLFIYANPTTDICHFSIPEELQNEENLTLLVYDNSGKLILQKEIGLQEGKISMNLEEQAKGIYQAVLTNGKKKYTGKVVVE